MANFLSRSLLQASRPQVAAARTQAPASVPDVPVLSGRGIGSVSQRMLARMGIGTRSLQRPALAERFAAVPLEPKAAGRPGTQLGRAAVTGKAQVERRIDAIEKSLQVLPPQKSIPLRSLLGKVRKHRDFSGQMRILAAMEKQVARVDLGSHAGPTVRGIRAYAPLTAVREAAPAVKAERESDNEPDMLALRFDILKLPAGLNKQANAELATIRAIPDPAQRNAALNTLARKLSEHHRPTSDTSLVMTHYRDVNVTLTRTKDMQLSNIRLNLLKLPQPMASAYGDLLADILKKPATERDALLDTMARDVTDHLTG